VAGGGGLGGSLTGQVREPRFADLHADPRFERLLNMVGLEAQ
jgi:hypothetical protein